VKKSSSTIANSNLRIAAVEPETALSQGGDVEHTFLSEQKSGGDHTESTLDQEAAEDGNIACRDRKTKGKSETRKDETPSKDQEPQAVETEQPVSLKEAEMA
jgi:hypothetical protein